MRIAIDAMGGDKAPEAIINGVIEAAKADTARQLILVGLEKTLAEYSLPDNVTPVVCGSVMGMDEDVRSLMRKRDSSIWIATDLVKKGEADAVVSAGSTGAQMAAATLLLQRIPGVERPALGLVIPTLHGGRLLLDVGANPECTPEMLLQFAEMGSVYAQQLMDAAKPRVALLSNGTEPNKGNSILQAAYTLLEGSSLNFIGNMEGRDVFKGDYDVMVCDGLSGNIVIKSAEGTINTMMIMIKREFTANLKTKIGAALVKKGLRRIKQTLDYQEYGGAPLLGVGGVSVVCHGSSGVRAISQAINVAERCVKSGLVSKLQIAVKSDDAAGKELE